MTTRKTSSTKTTQTKAATTKKVASTKPAEVRKPEINQASVPKAAPDDKLTSALRVKGKKGTPALQPPVTPTKEMKTRKVKLIRDSFTMPAFDYELIAALKSRALGNNTAVKKSELLRAGLHALNKLEASQLVALVSALEIVKTGRPKK